jgi:hypothetical protein
VVTATEVVGSILQGDILLPPPPSGLDEMFNVTEAIKSEHLHPDASDLEAVDSLKISPEPFYIINISGETPKMIEFQKGVEDTHTNIFEYMHH